MQILSVGTTHPSHFHDQETLIQAFEAEWARTHHNVARVRRFHEAVMVHGRYLALPVEEYAELDFTRANDAFIRVGLDIGQQAIEQALELAGLEPADIDALFTASVTGIATPSLDARLFHRMDLRSDLKRTPIFGLGCVAGASGLARAHDYLKAYPDQVAVLLCVELCSLTLQRTDLSIANLVASGLFGDGAAAVVCVGEERAAKLGKPGPHTVASLSRLYPDSERTMGWEIGSNGFRVVLDKSVPDVVHNYLADDVDGFLASHNMVRDDIDTWICHPGGPKVITAYQESLGCDPEAFRFTRESLAREGNMSSASVLFVLRDTLASGAPEPGSNALLMAMGPGFCSELVLLRG